MDRERVSSVGEVAALAGISVRTLHHYDRIGLLSPSARSAAGYREYSTADMGRLAQILAYRAGGLGLPEIAEALAATGTGRVEHLRRQLRLLDARAEELNRQRITLARALEASEMGINLDPEEIIEVFGDDDPRQYADEVDERWGQTDAYRESHRRTSSYTKDDWARIRQESEEIEAELSACLTAGLPADSERAKAAAEHHRRHIDSWSYPCSYEMQVGLSDMYVADARFAEHYDSRSPGLSTYVRDAIVANALDHLS